MLRIFRSKKAQNLLEYALLVAIVATALMAMSRYIQGAVNARIKQAQLELNEAAR